MKEEYLHYLFQARYFGSEFVTTKGEKLSVVDFGQLNVNAGPDFSEAKIKFDDKIWAGPIEFHVQSSDWFKHNHQVDQKYNNVIAHFVLEDDKEVKSGEYLLPTVELKDKVDYRHYSRYQKLSESMSRIPCESQLANMNREIVESQIELASYQRIQRKAEEFILLLGELKGDREKAFYSLVAKSFGAIVNQNAFINLMSRIDLSWLSKLNYNQFKVEALFFGISGLLPNIGVDDYSDQLIKEYNYQKKLFNIQEMNAVEWKYSSMRPPNFPVIRIAQMASLMSQRNLTQFLNRRDFTDFNLENIFSLKLDTYWRTHYKFENITKIKRSDLTSPFISHILVNAIVPYLYGIGFLEDDAEMKNRAMDILNKLPSESNMIISNWKKLGFKSKSAFDSQGLIEMKNGFCNRKKCLFCRIGIELLRK